jgi:aubergine-like protein
MTGRARGRARGRGQGEGAVAPAPGPVLAAAADLPPPAAAISVMGRGRPIQRGDMASGDLRSGGVSDLEAGIGAIRMGGEGGDRREGGRDRGRRRGGPETFTVTRPAGLQDKRGTFEPNQEVSLVTNYFRMETAPDFHLYQYHVSFQPEIISKGLRSILVREQAHLIGKVKAFDGTVLFLPIRLPSDETEVTAQKKDGTNVKIRFTLTSVVPPSSYGCLQVYNIIFRRVLKLIEMQQIGRNYFNPNQAVLIKHHGLEIWPGFATSILNYETSVLLMCDVSHKILRIKTVCEELVEIHNSNPDNFREEAMKKLLGQIVLTRYNNKTYKVDNIDFECGVHSKFERSDGKKVSYVEYYKEHYQIDIHDKAQPMLVSSPKKSDIRRGQDKPIYLVPELCTLTGLSEEVRTDFRVMKDVAEFTRVGPAGRTKAVQDLINVINNNEGVKQEMSGWGVRFASSLLQLSGHVLKQETVSMNKRPLQFDPLKPTGREACVAIS